MPREFAHDYDDWESSFDRGDNQDIRELSFAEVLGLNSSKR